MKWIRPEDEPVPTDVLLFAQVEVSGSEIEDPFLVCSVSEDGRIEQPFGPAEAVTRWNGEVLRYLLLEDVVSAIEDEDD
ncbi:MAG: hypothetical protein WC683_00885 [bacterium]